MEKSKQISPVLFIIVTALALSVCTFFHDPLLHGLIAILNGWHIESFSTQMFTGQTTISIPATTPYTLSQAWIFFMFPALTLITLAIVFALYFKNRIMYIFSTILIMLNFASIDPGIVGTDANRAMLVLEEFGVSHIKAYMIHMIILAMVIIVFALYQFIIYENNPSDSTKRMKRII